MTLGKPFSLLAEVYDAIMEDVDYEDWVAFILRLAGEAGWLGKGRLLDLGCGTGNSSAPFVRRGFSVTGLDASEEMLRVARAKLPQARFVHGEFTDFALKGRFGLAVSVFDALNNLLTPADFLRACERVYRHLTPGGVFIFDVNTTQGLRDLWEGDRAEGWVGELHYLWEHSFDETTGLAKVVAYCETGGRSFTEVHFERPYDPPELEALLTRAGFVGVRVLTYPEGEPPGPDTERVWVVAKRPA